MSRLLAALALVLTVLVLGTSSQALALRPASFTATIHSPVKVPTGPRMGYLVGAVTFSINSPGVKAIRATISLQNGVLVPASSWTVVPGTPGVHTRSVTYVCPRRPIRRPYRTTLRYTLVVAPGYFAAGPITGRGMGKPVVVAC